MTCKHCGAPIAEGAKFCENCGNKIEVETVETTVEETYKEPERVEADIVEEGPKAQETASSYDSEPTYNNASAAPTAPAGGPIGYSVASLVCGILGILCCCCGIIGFIPSVAGIVLGIVSIKKECEGKGLAIAGIACGGVGAAIFLISTIASLATGSFGLGNSFDSIDDITDFLESL